MREHVSLTLLAQPLPPVGERILGVMPDLSNSEPSGSVKRRKPKAKTADTTPTVNVTAVASSAVKKDAPATATIRAQPAKPRQQNPRAYADAVQAMSADLRKEAVAGSILFLQVLETDPKACRKFLKTLPPDGLIDVVANLAKHLVAQPSSPRAARTIPVGSGAAKTNSAPTTAAASASAPTTTPATAPGGVAKAATIAVGSGGAGVGVSSTGGESGASGVPVVAAGALNVPGGARARTSGATPVPAAGAMAAALAKEAAVAAAQKGADTAPSASGATKGAGTGDVPKDASALKPRAAPRSVAAQPSGASKSADDVSLSPAPARKFSTPTLIVVVLMMSCVVVLRWRLLTMIVIRLEFEFAATTALH